MNPQIISLHVWISLPNEVRHRIRARFNISRSSNTVVNDNKIESDGTTYEDLKNLTVEKMQQYLSSIETDYHKLFDATVVKITNEMNGVVEQLPEVKETPHVKKNDKKTSKK